MSSLFYIFFSYRKYFVVSIITIDTNIVKKTLFGPVLGKDTIFGITFAIKYRQNIGSKEFWTEDNQKYVIPVLYRFFIWIIQVGLNHHQRHQYHQ